MAEYSFFLDGENGNIGVAIDDGRALSVAEYNELKESGKPTVMELLALLLENYPEEQEYFRKRLVLIDDPEWDIRELLIYMHDDGGEDVLAKMFKADRQDVAVTNDLLPGITYRELFENTVHYTPPAITEDEEQAAEAESEPLIAAAQAKPGWRDVIRSLKRRPGVLLLLIIAPCALGFGLYSVFSKPATVILPPKKLQQAAEVDQKLLALQLKAVALQRKTAKDKPATWPPEKVKEYSSEFKALNNEYRQLRRLGFGNNKFSTIGSSFKQIRLTLRAAYKHQRKKRRIQRMLQRAQRRRQQQEKRKKQYAASKGKTQQMVKKSVGGNKTRRQAEKKVSAVVGKGKAIVSEQPAGTASADADAQKKTAETGSPGSRQ